MNPTVITYGKIIIQVAVAGYLLWLSFDHTTDKNVN